jgi:hypothetical protein
MNCQLPVAGTVTGETAEAAIWRVAVFELDHEVLSTGFSGQYGEGTRGRPNLFTAAGAEP